MKALRDLSGRNTVKRSGAGASGKAQVLIAAADRRLMSKRARAPVKLRIVPATAERWPDLDRLFGENGGCAGCWCMWWKLTRASFNTSKGGGNRRALRQIVKSGVQPGLIAYAAGEPIGWCAIEPREVYPRIARGGTLPPTDDARVWSITCFFVTRAWRRQGVTSALIEAAVRHARRMGARLVEAYPVKSAVTKPAAAVYTGLASTFRRAGFVETMHRSPARIVVRRAIR